MQDHNSSFGRTFLLALFIFVLAINPLMADDARAVLITFDDYPVGTPITDQYSSLGVIFSGEPGPPTIAPPSYWGITDPALSGYALPYPQWGSGSFTVTFVDPTNGAPVDAVNALFNYYILFGTSVTFTFYDIN